MKQIHWFRNDLRVHDHPVFANTDGIYELIPIFFFDENLLKSHTLGFSRMGSFRLKFLRESLENLQASLAALGSQLLILKGDPCKLIPQLVEDHKIDLISLVKEAGFNEVEQERLLSLSLNIPLESYHAADLLHPEDLPFDVKDCPHVFTPFRKKVEDKVAVRPIFETPMELPDHQLNSLDQIGLDEIWPNTKTLGDDRAALQFKGGEQEGLKRLHYYFWESDCISNYKETRNELLGGDYSSKFSPWLANGSLSPKRIKDDLSRYEKEVVKNKSTYWLYFELLWRDFFRLVSKKHGAKLFAKGGIKGKTVNYSDDKGAFEEWMEGKTGVDFVDANMRELKCTGFMSNRGRQIVASFLVNDLRIDWRWGAAYFENQLIDYDVNSNYGNWIYVAGVGNDPRENRYFDIEKQQNNYDPDGSYRKHWLNALGN